MAQGVGDELGDHQDEGVRRVWVGCWGEAAGEGAGGLAGLADNGRAVAPDNGRYGGVEMMLIVVLFIRIHPTCGQLCRLCRSATP
ncbi:hypothetical protein, partial [Streptomyces sp. NPDC048438]|uniref:hypothetical protein n=1 Tax=Streptomyces sp. NPDC048438 TaxID=3365551 RepID=UPI0037173ADF